jgi:hypothetical protein
MNQTVRQHALIVVALVLTLLASALVMLDPLSVNGQAIRRWNPRRVPANTVFLGDQVCLDCHKKFASFDHSGMAMAMEQVGGSKILGANPQLTMRIGAYSYQIKRDGKQSFYSVTDGKDTISLPILYAFGQGKMGQTYVLQHEGKFYESLVSFYNESKALDFTIGAARMEPKSLIDAVGRVLSPNEVSNCFGCHATGAVIGSQLRLENFTHGVRCESCHGPGGKHVEAVKAGEPGSTGIFDPGLLSGDELTQQFCASCHRGADEFALLKSMEINNVRFQPYRIFHSKCYSDDRKISCIACHNPHEPLKENAPAYYDKRCLECHTLKSKTAKASSNGSADGGSSCPVAEKDCTSCHMPKIEVKAAHFKFTDHYIRIVRPGEKFPN